MLSGTNFDLQNIITPVDPHRFLILLQESCYDRKKTKFIIDGFTDGFEIGYQGRRDIQLKSNNLKLNVGSPTELWNKMIKEVQNKRFAGPFEEVPFEYFMQSPIGLVPKDNGKATRLIFHLSYPRRSKEQEQLSLNANTPKDKCSVTYSDF